MAAKIVHDDDVSRLEHRHELLLDIGSEALAIDWSVEDAGRCEAVEAQGSEECQCAPMSVRCKATQSQTSTSPAPERCHVGLDPGLVDEHQASRVETGLPSLPTLPAACDVGACLLKSEQAFF